MRTTSKLGLLRWPAGRVLAAVAIWAAHFGIVYGITALACPRGFAAAVPWSAGAATLVATAAVLALIVATVRGSRPHTAAKWTAAAMGGLALAAILWQASPLLLEEACGLHAPIEP